MRQFEVLAPYPAKPYIGSMSNREKLIEAARQLPEEMPLEKMLRELEFVLGVRTAMEQADRGEVVSPSEAKQLIRQWVCPS